MADRAPATHDLVKHMAALHSIEANPGRLEAFTRELQLNLDRLERISAQQLWEVEPAFIQPLKILGQGGGR